MKAWTSVALRVTLVLFMAGLTVHAVRGETTSAKQPSPLSQAADEFKALTRELGIRPESPPEAQEHHGPKMVWHGRVYENFRNDVLDAIPHEVKQNGRLLSPLRRNQFGFNISGPVLLPHLITNPKNTFFMLSYEGVRERIFKADLLTIPTVPQRVGDFSQTVNSAGQLLPIYDPGNTVTNPAFDPAQPVSTANLKYLRTQFPGNVIPANRLSPVALQALSFYPTPNTNIGPFLANNYFTNAPQTDDADGIIAKVDHPFRDRHRLTASTTISSGFLSPAKYFPNAASPTSPDQHFSTLHSELDYVYTASSNTVNSASLLLYSDVVRSGNAMAGTPFPIYSFATTFPTVTPKYVSMGTAYPLSRTARTTLEVDDTWSTRKGKHSVRLSGEADFYQVNSFNPTYPSGYFQFTPDITSLPGIIDTGDPFASFLLGLPANAEHTTTTAPSYFRYGYQAVSVQDRYTVRKDLTLTANLNFSRRTPRTEKYNRQSTVDPALIDPSNGRPGALGFAGTPELSRGMRPVNYDIDPTVAIAWNPRGSNKTVVHATYARAHQQIPITNGQWATLGFNAHQTFISPNTQLRPAIDLNAGVPPLATPLPDLSPSAADNTTADYMNLSRAEPVFQTAAVSVERDIPFNIAASAGANHNVGRNILVGDGVVNPNAISPAQMAYGNNLYDYSFRTALQPYPQYLGFELYGLYPGGRYQRDAAYLRLEKRASFGLTITAYYEFSKQLDDYSGPYGNQDFFDLRNDWCASADNTPQYFTLSYAYEFPFGPNQPLLNFSGVKGALVRGWSLSGNAYWNDGTPLAPHPEFNNTGDVLTTLNVDVVPGISAPVSHPGPSEWFNPAAFAQPADFTAGNGSRTLAGLLGPGYNSMDISLGKRLPIGGERAVEFNATALNVMNHGNWNYPDTMIGPANAPNFDAGKIIGSHGGRVIQLGLKFSF
jgi:hypothetical protein